MRKKEVQAVNCPYCGEELVAGTAEVTAFRSAARLRFYDCEEPEPHRLLGNLLRPGRSAENVEDEHPAYRCTICKKFFVEFNEGAPS